MISALHLNHSKRYFSRTLATLGIVIISALVATNANAQVLVADNVLNASNTTHFASQLAKTVEQYAKQIQQYTLQIQQYQQLLFKATSLGTNFSIMPNTMQPISDPSALIQANCGSIPGGGLIGSAVDALVSTISQPVAQAQQAICASIITIQVDKYNKTVAALGSIENYSSSLTKLTDVVNGISNLGSSSAATTEVSAYSSQMQTAMGHWQAQIEADDAVIKALQSQQIVLAKEALNGGGASTILTQALPDVAFEAAVHSIQ